MSMAKKRNGREAGVWMALVRQLAGHDVTRASFSILHPPSPNLSPIRSTRSFHICIYGLGLISKAKESVDFHASSFCRA